MDTDGHGFLPDGLSGKLIVLVTLTGSRQLETRSFDAEAQRTRRNAELSQGGCVHYSVGLARVFSAHLRVLWVFALNPKPEVQPRKGAKSTEEPSLG